MNNDAERRARYSEKTTRVSLDLEDPLLAVLKRMSARTQWSQNKILRMAIRTLDILDRVDKAGGDFALIDEHGAAVETSELNLWLHLMQEDEICGSESTSRAQARGQDHSPSAPACSSSPSQG